MALEKATIVNQTRKEKFRVLFNPEEYSLTRDVNYAQVAIPGLSGPLLQFVHGNLQTLEMELFVDTYEAHVSGSGRANAAGDDVRALVGKIVGSHEHRSHDPRTAGAAIRLGLADFRLACSRAQTSATSCSSPDGSRRCARGCR